MSSASSAAILHTMASHSRAARHKNLPTKSWEDQHIVVNITDIDYIYISRDYS